MVPFVRVRPTQPVEAHVVDGGKVVCVLQERSHGSALVAALLAARVAAVAAAVVAVSPQQLPKHCPPWPSGDRGACGHQPELQLNLAQQLR
mgnify:FL=1